MTPKMTARFIPFLNSVGSMWTRLPIANSTPARLPKGQVKEYTFPSGKQVLVAGYEPFALDYLLRFHGEEEIKVHPAPLKYQNGLKTREYTPDAQIALLLVEVKSYYTLFAEEEKNRDKIRGVLAAGFNLQLMVFERNGRLAENVRFNHHLDVESGG
jgi:hypothetical protein